MPPPIFAKGLNKFIFNTIEDELIHAWGSIYRYWWSALRCSRDYWWVCQEKGKTLDPQLKRVYEAFGPVHGRTFSDWWRYSARDNFKEEIAPPVVTRIHSEKEIDGFDFDGDDWLLIKVPQGIKEPKLIEDFVKILRLRDKQVRRKTITATAAFPINKHRNLRLDVYERAFAVKLAMIQSAELANVNANDHSSYYELGVRCDVKKAHILRDADSPEVRNRKRNAMKVAVHRLLAKADALIANAEIGVFPSEAALEPRERWMPSQLKRMKQAMADGAWQPQLMTNNEWGTELRLVHEYEQQQRNEVDMFAGPRHR